MARSGLPIPPGTLDRRPQVEKNVVAVPYPSLYQINTWARLTEPSPSCSAAGLSA